MDLWFSEPHTPDVKMSIRVDRQLHSEQSEFQRIDIFESKEFGRFLTLDGLMMLTEKDEFILFSIVIMTGPLLIVTPIGSRNFLPTYILFIWFLLELLCYILSSKKTIEIEKYITSYLENRKIVSNIKEKILHIKLGKLRKCKY